MSRRRARLVTGLAALLLALAAGGGLEGQEGQEGEPPDQEAPLPAPDTIPLPPADTAAPPGGLAPEDRPGRPGCPLVLESATNLNRIQRGGAYVYYIGGGMLWRCGNAEMVADSAVRYEAARRIEMMGEVDYRDTIRTLSSDFLTYYERPDLVIATGDVRLTRTSTGSTLEGPRVEFLRAVSGREELTTATGRPHLTLYPTAEYEGAPFDVDADVAELAGEEMARARGDVVIRRPDLLARADSAVFDIAEGGGVLYGSPEVEGRGFRLSGDTIRLRFQEEELREVWARGRAFAAGESFEVVAEQVRARIEAEKAREVWAYGGDRSIAISASYRVYGDSLRFALSEGRIDTVVAVGEAIAEEEAATEGDAGAEGVAGLAVGDTMAAAEREQEEAVPPRDTAAVRRVERSRPGAIPAPTLGLGGTASWMTGDTLVADFEAAAPDSLAGGEPGADRPPRAEEREPAGEGAAAAGGVGEPRGAEARDVERGAPPDTAGRRLRRIHVVSDAGTARAYYAAVMDSSRTLEPSRNYIVGRAIEILFEDGAVARVSGDRAIGVYLDPGEPEGPAEPGAARRGAGNARSPEPGPIETEGSGPPPGPEPPGTDAPRRVERQREPGARGVD